jgi:hypothetical protein
MRLMARLMLAVFSCIAIVALVGCGDLRTVEAKGVLTWEDGTPISGANLQFISNKAKGHDAVGFTDKQGEFSLSTGNKPGAPAGEYTVVVTKPAGVGVIAGGPGDDPAVLMKKVAEAKKTAPKNEIPVVYADKNSPLKVTIAPGQKIELKLKKS